MKTPNPLYLITKRLFFIATEIKQNSISIFKNKSYESFVESRHSEAERTAFIVYQSTPQKLYDYTENFGKIETFLSFKRVDKQYALIEYQNLTSTKKLLQTARHFPNEHRIPYSFGKCLYFHSHSNLYVKQRTPRGRQDIVDCSERNLNNADLLGCSNIDSQMELLYNRFSMSELDIRLKFFIASEVEAVTKRIFPDCKVSLFGSSVNGLGRFNGDADMTLSLEKNHTNHFGSLHDHPLYFMSRIRPEESRQFAKNILDILGGLLSCVTPQMMNVRRILRARVPIVKFVHSPTEIECDICLNNESAIVMSRLLNRLISLNSQFSMIIFTLRQWARCNHVISPHPGPWLTNFMITLLVLFRFQIFNPPLLPPLNKMYKVSNSKEVNVSNIKLEELLLDFFTFYADFNFEEKGISPLAGECISKPDPLLAIYIENPIEPELNICKNVSAKYMVIFKDACALAAEKLKSRDVTKFGLLNILSLVDPIEEVLRDSCEYYADGNDDNLNENTKKRVERTIE